MAIIDAEQWIIFIDGKEKTDKIEYIRKRIKSCGNYGSYGYKEYLQYEIQYKKSNQTYIYNADKIHILKMRQEIDLADQRVLVNGKPIYGIARLLDFGPYYRIIRKDRSSYICSERAVKIMDEDEFRAIYGADDEEDQLQRKRQQQEQERLLLEYFRKTAEVVGLTSAGGGNTLLSHFESLASVPEDSVLACYIRQGAVPRKRQLPSTIIYPFGINLSQKKAVENALSSQVSIIQGPPGTGKTQTILNIIANVVCRGETVAMVSNNNSAVQNVQEKLVKYDLDFLAASLGNKVNKERFLESQTGVYPDMGSWGKASSDQLVPTVRKLTGEAGRLLAVRNELALLRQERMEAETEDYYHEYHAEWRWPDLFQLSYKEDLTTDDISTEKILSFWRRVWGTSGKRETQDQLLDELSDLFQPETMAVLRASYGKILPYLQFWYCKARIAELSIKEEELDDQLADEEFQSKIEALTEKSLQLFWSELAGRYRGQRSREKFDARDLYTRPAEFSKEYPIILSTAYSLKGTLGKGHMYDYLIVDEASQVDLVTGVLALSCARNIVIVGDLKQLPNVVPDSQKKKADVIWAQYTLPEACHYSTQNLLSSAVSVWSNAPAVLLREHYRCHPKIIGFCNQKFYGGQLLAMTEDHGEKNVLCGYAVPPGAQTQDHVNQAQIDVIKQITLNLRESGCQDIGIIAPYQKQVQAIQQQLNCGEDMAATVHKFQGREKEAMILSTTDEVIGDFVDDPHMLNVAVSRAVSSLCIVRSKTPLDKGTNYADLIRYIQYHRHRIKGRQIWPISAGYYRALTRRFPSKKGDRSGSDMARRDYYLYLMEHALKEVLAEQRFAGLEYVRFVQLDDLVPRECTLDPEEEMFIRKQAGRVQFLIFRKINNAPVGALEIDVSDSKSAKQIIHILSTLRIPCLSPEPTEVEDKVQLKKRISAFLEELL